MDWAGVIESFIGTFAANTLLIIVLYKVAVPKIKKTLNPFGGLE